MIVDLRGENSLENEGEYIINLRRRDYNNNTIYFTYPNNPRTIWKPQRNYDKTTMPCSSKL